MQIAALFEVFAKAATTPPLMTLLWMP